ncbi:protein involved in spore germination [Arthrobacter sp. Hiyo8]|uniref:amino acid transporter n=1 Tax=Arthrobacter sp. Hiyo1 TaxID=1588020 RepID=UPI0006839648|nr:amino acid transporter [Arthrobacter sp. Hiyo1]BAS13823.1 protein involved in spore germination [Arthrobacter sp. Hiyo8]GAP58541.1 protein involved in spore germination [Arthrobacter sp. Hiyo1]
MTTLTRPPAEPSDRHKPAGDIKQGQFKRWLLDGMPETSGKRQGPHGKPDEGHTPQSWWKVMCLTGVDYFSTLGYQPAIAALAAGIVSPLATIVLVAVTLLGALPVYRRVASESARGEGSIAMLERLLPRWGGKLFVLALLGFAATDFMITMTLSAADASAHAIENPFAPEWLHGQEITITLALIAGLGVVFLRGFKEAINVAVVLVGVYLVLNAVVVAVGLAHVVTEAHVATDWWAALNQQHGNPLIMVGIALLVFPKLALGLSGFETGVAVMPQIKGSPSDTEENPAGRIRGTHKLLTTAALIMSAFLVASSFITTFLIPAAEFQPGGKADGRALAFLAHQFLGDGFGTVYDISTIAILWFAGASAMAGLLNLVPRYLPRFGMAPAWTKAVRPLVLVFTAVGFIITLVFEANVEAQGGAYATGVLVLMTSASIAVTLSARRKKQRGKTLAFGAVAVVFAYTTVANVVERPDGIRIAALFILGIVLVSFASRVRRSFELRATHIKMDQMALEFTASNEEGPIRIIAHEPKRLSADRYELKLKHAQQANHLPVDSHAIFIEIIVDDSSDFEQELLVEGKVRHGFKILEIHSNNVPNTLAAVLLHIRDVTGLMPHIYFRWTEGNPIANLSKFLFFGEGEIAPVTREVLREAEPDITRRPWVHVG